MTNVAEFVTPDGDDANYRILDLRSNALEAEDVAGWARRQVVPVIGVTGDRISQAADELDLLVSGDDEAGALCDRIDAAPMAAAVLVQVTRTTVQLPIADALVVESLGYATLQGGAEFQCWLRDNERPQSREIEEPVRLDRQDDVLRIILVSPENRNAFSAAMRDGLTEAFRLVALDDSIRQVIVEGEGPCFSAGGDLSEFGSMKDLAEAHRIRQLSMPARYLAKNADRYVFRLHGACIGAGIELPAFAARVEATSDAWFQLPEVGMGLIPGAGGCVSIPRRIGRQRTNELAITGRKLSVQEALDWGLVDAIVS